MTLQIYEQKSIIIKYYVNFKLEYVEFRVYKKLKKKTLIYRIGVCF